jgi:TonB family protein
MSGVEVAVLNLAAWSVQVAVLVLAAAAAGRLLPVERPAPRLLLLQAMLVASLLLPLLQPWRTPAPGIASNVRLGADPLATAPSPATPPPTKAGLSSPIPAALVAAALVAGALIQLGRLALRLARLRAVRRSAAAFDAPAWLTALRDELAPAARVMVSDAVPGPATFGLRRPVVLLPGALRALPEEDQRAVLLHELVHVRRGDWLALLVEELLAAVFFFHPAVHWLLRRVQLAREQCVDAEVVARLGGRHAYLDSLVEVARFSVRARAVPAATFLTESHLRERVDLLLREASMSRFRTVAHVASTAAALVLAVSWTAVAVPLQGSSKAALVDLREDTDSKDLKPVQKVNPAYPASAKEEGVQGVYMLDIVIGTDGSMKSVKVAASAATMDRLKQIKGSAAAIEGDKRLAEAAIAAVQQWRYEPISRDGKPVEVRATVTVNFKLD